jgi:rifampicin phosphotransferase
MWAERHPGPVSYGKQPPPPPSLKGFPPEVREVVELLLWRLERFMPNTHNQEIKSNTLSGVGASSGTYTGPVRVIKNESEFSKLRRGDVMVCPLTTPSWSILFPDIGALVADKGGILSHPAIIAREYGVPAVVATANGTTLLNDGDVVTVDGDSGLVKLEKTS